MHVICFSIFTPRVTLYTHAFYNSTYNPAMMLASLLAAVLPAQYPTVRPNGYVEIGGVPVSLVVDPPLTTGKYRAFDLDQSTANEYNCNCRVRTPVWTMRIADSVLLRRYEDKEGAVGRTCSVAAYGYRWQNAPNFGLVMEPNAETPNVPALLGIASKMGADYRDATLFELGHAQHNALTDYCDTINPEWCTQAESVAQCFSDTQLDESTTKTFKQCCWIEDAEHRSRPAVAGATFKSRITTPCFAEGICVARANRMMFPDTTYAFSHGDVEWLPPFPSINIVDTTAVFCVINQDPITARFTFVSTGDAVEDYGSAGKYPGTCLKPALFVKGAVTPPSMITRANGSVHYCDATFPAATTPFSFAESNTAFTFCHNDALTRAERRDVCRKGGSEVLLGKQLNYRSRVTDACDMADKVCVLIPGDTFHSVGSVLATDLDATGFTFIYLNIHMDVLQLLLIDPAVADLVYDTDINTSPLRSALDATEHSILLKHLPPPSRLVGDAFCGGMPMTPAVLAELQQLLESRRNPDGSYTFLEDTVSSDATVVLTDIYADFYETTTVPFSDIKIRSAFEDRPATVHPVDCSTFFVTAAGFTVRNVVFNQSTCLYGEPYDRVPIVIAGNQAEHTHITNITLVNAESPVMFQAGPTQKTRWVQARATNITGSLVEGVRFHYDPHFYSGEMFITAMLGGTSGSAAVKGVDQGITTTINTSLTPQSTCTNNICIRPNNTRATNTVVLIDVSTCAQGCHRPVSSLDGGVTCPASENTGMPLKDCSEYEPHEIVAATVVDSIGLKCEIVFATDATACADRELAHDCADIVGEARCARYYDRDVRTCVYAGGATCVAGTPCTAAVAQSKISPDSGPMLLDSLRANVTRTAPPLQQQFFVHSSFWGNAVICTATSPFNNTGCIGGCADHGSERCTPNVCPRVHAERFACIAPPLEPTGIAGFETQSPTLLTDPDTAAVFHLASHDDLIVTQLVVNHRCVARTPAAALEWTACNDNDPNQRFVFNRLDAPHHTASVLYQLAIPEAPFDCITAANNDSLLVAPCFPCHVAPGNTAVTFENEPPTLFAIDAVPEHYIAVPVSHTRAIAVNKSDPSVCRYGSTEAPCNSATTWRRTAETIDNPVGLGLLLAGKAAMKRALSAVKCPHTCFGTNLKVHSQNGANATVDCFGSVCYAVVKGSGFEYGERVFTDGGNRTLGLAVVESVLLQATKNFTLAAIGAFF